MNWLATLFGIKPDRRKKRATGFYWQSPNVPAVAAGRGWNQAVVGEYFYHATLERLTKGATRYGVLMSEAAELVAGEHEGSPAVFVYMGGERVGAIPKADSQPLHDEILAITERGRVSVKGQVSAGFEGGDYCVKLSLSRPLRTMG